ncbi:MAG: ABC transporter permease subunit [Microbacteriaceae bacterium]|nr:ABC transporter permease subunit [Microbacteriaceae bacterium]
MPDLFGVLFAAGLVNVQLTVLAFPLAIAVALVTAAIRIVGIPFLAPIVVGYVEIVRTTPLLLHLFFVFYVLPLFGLVLDAWPAAVLTFALHFGAYLSEVFRAAHTSISTGVLEAATVLGLRGATRVRRITIPVAIRVAFPPTANTLIEAFRSTPVVALVAVPDILFAALSYIRANPGTSIVPLGIVALFFCVTCIPTTMLLRRLERRWRVG